MKLDRLPYDPATVLQFFQEGLEALGAVCERSWHDRLHLVAEGNAASLWNSDGQLLETEIHFPPPNTAGPRDSLAEVFPGCPLVFHLAEALRRPQATLDRAILQTIEGDRSPTLEVMEKLWHAQFPGVTRWKLVDPIQQSWHFSLLALLRCEIQAIDQHWSLHRLLISFPDGQRDETLARSLDFADLAQDGSVSVPWPNPPLEQWQQLIRHALTEELQPDLDPIRQRQENYLRRELQRIEDYFGHYKRELSQRLQRQNRAPTRFKAKERLAAAEAEHQRRRRDQVQRHEIRVIPHLERLVLLAEPAWTARLGCTRHGQARTEDALFVPRARRWIAKGTPPHKIDSL